MRRMVLMLMCTIAAAAACNDSTAPARREVRRITNIRIPARAANTDSIRITFDYDAAPCDSGMTVETRPTPSDIRFVVTSYPTGQNCPYALAARINIPVVYVVAPPHATPYTAKFAEPAEPDS